MCCITLKGVSHLFSTQEKNTGQNIGNTFYVSLFVIITKETYKYHTKWCRPDWTVVRLYWGFSLEPFQWYSFAAGCQKYPWQMSCCVWAHRDGGQSESKSIPSRGNVLLHTLPPAIETEWLGKSTSIKSFCQFPPKQGPFQTRPPFPSPINLLLHPMGSLQRHESDGNNKKCGNENE